MLSAVRRAALTLAASGAIAMAMVTQPALAGLGQPSPWQTGLQQAATPVQQHVIDFHNFILPIIAVICLFVLILLGIIVYRYNAARNPVAERTTHNVPLEIAWTVVPVLILVAIAIPSFRLLYEEQTIPNPDLTVKTTGRMWYWSYEYPDHGRFTFDSYMVEAGDLKPGQPRLLAVDNEVVVPVNKVVRVEVTGGDVLHSFTVPSFGIKVDAVPGRLNETWFKAVREGIYYGQCSELCGQNHAFMPIAVRVVSEDTFTAWVAEAQRRAQRGAPPASVAEIEANLRLAAAEAPQR